MKRPRVQIWLSVLVLLPLCSVSAQDFYPKDMQVAEQTIAIWLSQLKGKTQREVETQLGPPAARSTWDYKGTKLPKIQYNTPGNARLDLYFSEGDRVVTVSSQLIP